MQFLNDQPIEDRLETLRLHNNTKVKKRDSLVKIDNFSKTYCSIQLVTNNEKSLPIDVAHTYFNWLTSVSKKIFIAKYKKETYKIYVFFLKNPLLELSLLEINKHKVIFKISGGILAKQNQLGTFSFLRSSENEYAIALERFAPRLPWFFYKLTQAPIHEIVMKQFQKKMRVSQKCRDNLI